MKKKRNESLFEKKMANRKFREQFEKESPLFELEVQVLNAIEKKGRWKEDLSSEEIDLLEKILGKQGRGKIMNAEEFKKHLEKL